MSTADDAYRFCGLFEAELLLELMLRFWFHPLANEFEFRNDLLENTTEVLRSSTEGQQLLASVPAQQMNFVSAVWYAEWTTLQGAEGDLTENELKSRREWLATVRRTLPSCFCDQTDLTD